MQLDTYRSSMIFILIPGSENSVWYFHQTRRQSTAMNPSQTRIVPGVSAVLSRILGDNVLGTISFPTCASFFSFFFEVEINSRTLISSFCQDESTVA